MTRGELIIELKAHAAAIRQKVATGDLSLADLSVVLSNQELIMEALAEILLTYTRRLGP